MDREVEHKMSGKLDSQVQPSRENGGGREGSGHGVGRHCCCLQLPNEKV